MKAIWYFLFCIITFSTSCSSDDDPISVDPEEVEDPLLISVDVKSALAMTFGYSGNETRLQTIHADKTIGQPDLIFQGDSQGLEKDFHVCDINMDYYLLVAPTYKHIYFVDKKTGKANQSVYFPIDYLNTFRIACHDNTCYFIDPNHTLYRLTNFLSKEAEFEKVNSISFVSSIEQDVDGMYFIWSDKGRGLFDGEKLTNIPSYVGFWKGRDGLMRIIDKDGNISKYTASTLSYEQSIPSTVTKISTINFPQYETSVGFQYNYDLLMFFELEKPYATAIRAAPQMNDDIKPFFQISLTGYGKHLYFLYGLPNKIKELQKLDVETFTLTNISPVTPTFNSSSVFIALREDLIMMVICRSPDGCQDELVFLNSEGVFTFPEFWGQASIRYIRF